MAFQQQRAEGQRLAGRPVQALAATRSPASSASSWRAIFGFTPKSAGTRQSAAPTSRSVSSGTAVSCSCSTSSEPTDLMPVQWPSSQSALFGLKVCAASKASSRRRLKASRIAFDSSAGSAALGSELLGVEGARRPHLLDAAVHDGLGEGRLVALVVAVAAVADDVEHDVRVEHHAELRRHARAEHHGFRVVAVHVQDRRLHALGDVRAVEAGIGVRRDGGEADLVVGDDVDRAAGAVADQLATSPWSRRPRPGRRRRRRHAAGCP